MPYGTTTLIENYWPNDTGPGVLAFKELKRRTRSGGTTPNYRNIPRDALPVNSYFDHTYHLHQSKIVHVITVPDNGSAGTHTHGGDFTIVEAETEYTNMVNDVKARMRADSSMRNEVILKALVKIADAKANLAVSLAEASKTSDLILSNASRFDKAYRAFRKGNLREVAKQLNLKPKSSHKTWLEYKYGWMPLLMEVKGAAEFLAQQALGGRAPRFSVSATLSDEGSYDNVQNLDSVAPGSTRAYKRTLRRKYRVKIWCEISNPHLSHMQQLGLTNPALYAWEVIPYSFVFDWFCSVGDWLTGVTALNGITVRRAMISLVSDANISRDTRIAAQRNPTGLTREFGNILTAEGRSYLRDPLSVDPLSLYPPVSNPFTSVSRLVTSLALLRARSKRDFGAVRV